jgi:hypothetical protein
LARFYHLDIARFAANADLKWVDNLLSHFDVPGVERSRQGMARRISIDGIYHIVLVRLLNRELGVSVSAAVSLAAQLLDTEAGTVPMGRGLDLELDVGRFCREVDSAIAEGVESLEPARRGRPPRATTSDQ